MFVSVVSTDVGRPTKYSIFENYVDATIHATEYNGAVYSFPGGSPEDWLVVGNEIVISPRVKAYTAIDVKAEARRRILTRYPDWKQANMNAEAVQHLLIRVEGGTWTPEQAARVVELQAAKEWIDSVRTASDAIEARLASEPDLDITDDILWPDG